MDAGVTHEEYIQKSKELQSGVDRACEALRKNDALAIGWAVAYESDEVKAAMTEFSMLIWRIGRLEEEFEAAMRLVRIQRSTDPRPV